MKKKILIVLILGVISQVKCFGQIATSWKGEQSAQWLVAANWTNGIPNDSTDAIIGDANFTGLFQPLISSSSRCKSLVLDSVKATRLVVNAEFYVQEDVRILSSKDSLVHTGGKLTVRGNWLNNGMYAASGTSAQVAFGGTNQTLDGTAQHRFCRLHVNGGSTLSLQANIQIKGVGALLSLNGTLNPKAVATKYVEADSIQLNNEGVLLVYAPSFELNYSTYPICKPGGVIDYASNSNQIVSSNICYATLRISGTGVKQLIQDLPPLLSTEADAGRIYINAGTFDMGTYTANRGTDVEGGYFTVADGAVLRIGGETVDFFPKNFKTTSLKNKSIVEFYGNGTQLVSPKNYGHLYLTTTSGTATKVLPTTILRVDGDFRMYLSGGDTVTAHTRTRVLVGGDFILEKGAVFNAGSYAHSVGGDFVNNAVLNAQSSSFSLFGFGKKVRGNSTFNTVQIVGNYELEDSTLLHINDHLIIADSARLINSSTSSLFVNSIRMQAKGKMLNYGTVAISDSIVFSANDNFVSSFVNNGAVTNSGIICLEKAMQESTGWYFMSFPFAIQAAQITDALTGNNLVWGDKTGLADFYVQQYDGYSRDLYGAPNTSGSGVYWVNVDSRLLNAYEGYIVAVEQDRIIAFTSISGEEKLFEKQAIIPLSIYTSNTSAMHHSWNLCGHPFSSDFNLLHASQSQAPFYLYDGTTYQTIMAGDNYEITPFSAFFMQAEGGNDLIYDSEGLDFRAASSFSEIDLTLSDSLSSDRLRIRFDPSFSLDYIFGEDGLKFMSLRTDIPQLYAKVGGRSYAVHALPTEVSGKTVIPIAFYAPKQGRYRINVNHLDKFNVHQSVFLKDNTTNAVLDLRTNSVYIFETNLGTYSNRLAITLETPINTNNHSVNIKSGIFISTVGGDISFEGLQGLGSVSIYDLTGKLMYNNNKVLNNSVLPVSLCGVYLLHVQTATQHQQCKVLLKKQP